MDSDELVERFASRGAGTHLFESTPVQQKKARKETRMRTGRNLQYKLGQEGRKTGVTRKENVRKDADDLDNVEDFFQSDDEEDLDESLDMPVGEASPVAADVPSPSDMSMASSRPGEASPFEQDMGPSPPLAKKGKSKKKKQQRTSTTPTQPRRSAAPTPTPAPDFDSFDEADDMAMMDDDVPAFDYNDSALADLPGEPYYAPLNDTGVGEDASDDAADGFDDDDDDEVSFLGDAQASIPDFDEVDTEDEEEEDDDDEDDRRSAAGSTKSASEFAQMRVQDLRQLCKDAGISYSKLTKKEMIKKLRRLSSSTPRRPTPQQRKRPVSTPRQTSDSDEEEDFFDDFMSDGDDDDDEGLNEEDSVVLGVADVSTWGSNRLKSELRRLNKPTEGGREELAKRLGKALQDEARSALSDGTGASPFSGKKSKKRKRNELAEESPDSWGLPAKRITRRPPLQYWKNEHVAYGRRKSGNFATVIDIVENDDDDSSPPRKKAKRATKSAARPVIHPQAPVFNWVNGEEMPYRVVKSNDMLRWNPLTKDSGDQYSSTVTKSAKEGKVISEDIEVAYTFNEGDSFSSGSINIGPDQATPMQNSSLSMEVFYLVSGTLEVTINKTRFVVKKGTHFFIPPENRFRLRNTNSRQQANLVFFRTIRTETADDEDED